MLQSSARRQEATGGRTTDGAHDGHGAGVTTPRRIPIADAQLEVLPSGIGEPVVFVQTALTADELVPLAREPALANAYRTILYHRRGYARSSAATGPGSVARDAADCAALLTALQVERAHVVGVSYSAAVALQLAAGAPDRVRTLTLLEPPPVHTPSADAFRAANARLLRTRRERGAAAALDDFLTMLVGHDWRTALDEQLAGSVEQMRRDAVTFFDVDLPAVLQWSFTPADAARVQCPVLHVGGTDSGPWFAEVRNLILDWFPAAVDVVIDGADHMLALSHSREIADAVVAFLRRHPMT